jgi:lipopolysaccharide transport protein LptA
MFLSSGRGFASALLLWALGVFYPRAQGLVASSGPAERPAGAATLRRAPAGPQASGRSRPIIRPLGAAPAAAAPTAFRCDALHTDTREHKSRAQGHVVLRHGEALLCCDVASGEADSSWQWQRIACHGDVRVSTQDALLWASDADYDPVQQRLVLTGSPRLRRGTSTLRGRRIVVELARGTVAVEQPQGELATAEVLPAGAQAAPAARAAPAEGAPGVDGSTASPAGGSSEAAARALAEAHRPQTPLPGRCPIPGA